MKAVSPNDRRVNRWQNLSIFLLALSAVFLFANLPLFGVLSDRSLLELARDRIRRENIVAQTERSSASLLALPVRMVYTNDFARLGADALTTLSDEFEHAGTYLGEALGCGAVLTALRRTKANGFTLAQARSPEALAADPAGRPRRSRPFRPAKRMRRKGRSSPRSENGRPRR